MCYQGHVSLNVLFVPHSKKYFLKIQDTYQELVKYLIESQTDPGNRQRLMEAFRKLTVELPMSAERIYRIRFRENFEKFVVEVRGFLLIK